MQTAAHFLYEDSLCPVYMNPCTQFQVNLSNIVDVMPRGDYLADLFKLVASKCKAGARIAHWGLFDPIPCPRQLEEEGLLVPLSDLTSQLFQQDKLFYSGFHLNEIPKITI